MVRLAMQAGAMGLGPKSRNQAQAAWFRAGTWLHVVGWDAVG